MINLYERMLLTWQELNPQPPDQSPVGQSPFNWAIKAGFLLNDTWIPASQFVPSPREREKWGRKVVEKRNEKKRDEWRKNWKDSPEMGEILSCPLPSFAASIAHPYNSFNIFKLKVYLLVPIIKMVSFSSDFILCSIKAVFKMTAISFAALCHYNWSYGVVAF